MDGLVITSETISQNDIKADKLIDEGHLMRGIDLREKGLVMRQQHLGIGHAHVADYSEHLAILYNTSAMSYAQQGKKQSATVLALLSKAEVLTKSHILIPDKPRRMKLAAITYNNFGCCLKQFGRLHAALAYLEKALFIEEALADAENPASTHLNVCAVLSSLGRHRGALEHAEIALDLIEELLRGAAEASKKPERTGQLSSKTPGSPRSPRRGPRSPTSRSPRTTVLKPFEEEDPPAKSVDASVGSVYCAALFNTAVELQFLGMYEDAKVTYTEARTAAESYIGPGCSMIKTIDASLKDVEKKAAATESRREAKGPKPLYASGRYAHKGKKKSKAEEKEESLPPWRPGGVSPRLSGGGAGGGATCKTAMTKKPDLLAKPPKPRASPRAVAGGTGVSWLEIAASGAVKKRALA